KEIEKGIEEADTFLAIVTPDWISSTVCIDELNIAVKNGKRLLPVVPCDIVWNDVHPALAHLNFIFFTENFDFNTQLDKLFTALNTDYDWLKTQRRLQVKALEWERAARGPELYEWPWGSDQEPTPETANMPWNEYTSDEYIPVGLLSVDGNPDGKSTEGIYNLVGNVSEWPASFAGMTGSDPTQLWNGNPDTYDGTLTYAARGGGWQRNVDDLSLYIPVLGTSAYN